MSASKYSEEFKQQVVSGVVENPLHDQRGGKILLPGPANRGKLGEQVEENPFRHRG